MCAQIPFTAHESNVLKMDAVCIWIPLAADKMSSTMSCHGLLIHSSQSTTDRQSTAPPAAPLIQCLALFPEQAKPPTKSE